MLTVVFTMVNVTVFAASRGVPWPIALLLDPMVALALATVLYADARLASWGLRPPGWSTALRWFAGLAATLMNTWSSLWPDGRPGWPRDADPAAVFLHAVPPVLLILLTETVAAYRRHLTPRPPGPRAPRSASTHQAGTDPDHNQPAPGTVADPAAGPDAAPASLEHLFDAEPPDAPHGTAPGRESGAGRPGGTAWGGWTGDDPGGVERPTTGPLPDSALLARAAQLDRASRMLTGRPVSIRRLRTELGIGAERARRIHQRLTATDHAADPAAVPEPARDAVADGKRLVTWANADRTRPGDRA